MHGRGHGGQGGRGRRRHGQRGRAAQMLEPTVLFCLHQGAAHGYALNEQLAEFGLGSVSLRRIYRLLSDMEEMGWVTSSWDTEKTQGPPRRIYRLTADGEAVLDEWVQQLRESRAALDRLLNAYETHVDSDAG